MSIYDAASGIDLMDLSMFVEGREMEVFDELRASDPVHWNPPSERGPGFWALTRYADVKAAASDHARLSSADGTQIVDRKVEGKLASLHNMDDPEHAQLRKVAFPQLRAIKIRAVAGRDRRVGGGAARRGGRARPLRHGRPGRRAAADARALAASWACPPPTGRGWSTGRTG